MALPLIKITPIKYFENEYLGLYFPFNEELVEIAKHIGCRWSQSLTCWYIDDSDESLRLVKEHFGKVTSYIIDETCTDENPYAIKQRAATNTLFNELTDEVKELLKNFIKYMERQRYSANTITTYQTMIVVFFAEMKEYSPSEITIKEVELFNDQYILKNAFSNSYQRQMISAIKLFYDREFDHSLDISLLQYPDRLRKLPVILSKEEVAKLIEVTSNLKHKTILSVIYSAGL